MTTLTPESELAEAPVLDIDPYSLPVLADPYPFHERLRQAGPVVRIKAHGVYAVGRFDEAKTVLADHTRFIAGAGIGIQDILEAVVIALVQVREQGLLAREPGVERPDRPRGHSRNVLHRDLLEGLSAQ